ncbi:MAG: hypothetical protein IKI06_09885 [Prevotella sp.]|nr:hypothetical protein [Prevotella sp.]
MKKYFVTFTLLAASKICSFGQTDQLYISVVQPERSEISAEAGKQLERKMTQLLTANGISSQDANNRFVITAKVDITSKDIVASTPQRISEKIDLTFLVGDVVENKVFETITLPLIGIGINENKAFIAAINQVKPQKAELSEFLNRAKNKIVEYYAVRCTQIIKQAQKLSSGNEYDEAIYQLMQVPDICDCAKQCQDLMIEYTIKRNNAIAAQLYNEAKARWAASPTQEGASAVADIIAKIPANTSSQSQINSLINAINKKLRDDEKRQWDFRMKQYNDAQEKEQREYQLRVDQQIADNKIREKRLEADTQQRKVEMEAKQRQQAEEQATRRKWIDAAKSVGLGFVNNLPKTIESIKNVMSW